MTEWEMRWSPYDEPTYAAVLNTLRPTDVVLDIGAGDLRLARRMAAVVRQVIAWEIQPDVLERGTGTTFTGQSHTYFSRCTARIDSIWCECGRFADASLHKFPTLCGKVSGGGLPMAADQCPLGIGCGEGGFAGGTCAVYGRFPGMVRLPMRSYRIRPRPTGTTDTRN